jgi:hypothetical protein
MFSVKITTNFTFEDVRKEIIDANDRAITNAAAVATTRVRPFIPVKSRRMLAQIGIRFFKQKNKMRAASIQVIGDRHFVAHILEYGTRDGRIPAKENFAKAFAAIESQLADIYTTTFYQTLEQKQHE